MLFMFKNEFFSQLFLFDITFRWIEIEIWFMKIYWIPWNDFDVILVVGETRKQKTLRTGIGLKSKYYWLSSSYCNDCLFKRQIFINLWKLHFMKGIPNRITIVMTAHKKAIKRLAKNAIRFIVKSFMKWIIITNTETIRLRMEPINNRIVVLIPVP